MNPDADRKRQLLAEWWADLLPQFSVRLLNPGEPLEQAVALGRLRQRPELCGAGPSVYVLFADLVPVYIGRTDDVLGRWEQHLKGWAAGTKSYARWRQALLNTDGSARFALVLLVVPATAITRPPIPGFPTTAGSVEYQLVGLAADAYPGRLLNHEGRGRC
jgi:hypothetical protein